MSLAGHEHDVAGSSVIQGRRDGALAVVLHANAGGTDEQRNRWRADFRHAAGSPDASAQKLAFAHRAQPGADFRDNPARIFRARVVIGDDDVVCELRGDSAHERPLARITIAAAPEHDMQAAFAMQTRSAQRLAQRIWRVCVVDDSERLRSAATKQLHATARRPAFAECIRGVGKRHAPGQQGRQHGEHVVDVEVSDERNRNFSDAPARLDSDDEP
jgi:hypothetical protein